MGQHRADDTFESSFSAFLVECMVRNCGKDSQKITGLRPPGAHAHPQLYLRLSIVLIAFVALKIPLNACKAPASAGRTMIG
jgi:hypothetical protein